jgi:hypothetical protein
MRTNKFKIGDRVAISGRDHPWYGEAGVIEDRAAPGWGSDWVVKLNGTMLPSCGVTESDIRKL